MIAGRYCYAVSYAAAISVLSYDEQPQQIQILEAMIPQLMMGLLVGCPALEFVFFNIVLKKHYSEGQEELGTFFSL